MDYIISSDKKDRGFLEEQQKAIREKSDIRAGELKSWGREKISGNNYNSHQKTTLIFQQIPEGFSFCPLPSYVLILGSALAGYKKIFDQATMES